MHTLYQRGATLDEVGDAFGLTRERVRQLFANAGLKSRTRSEAAALKRAGTFARADEIVERFRALRNESLVAGELAVPERFVKEILDARLTGSERRLAWKRPAKKYSDAELVEFLRQASASLGGVLTTSQYTEFARSRHTPDGRPWPTHQTPFKRFGSWRSALHVAGLASNPSSAIAGQRLFERAHCIDAVRAVARDLEKMPTAAEYDDAARQSGGSLPSQATVRARCGTWNQVLRLAGL
jgi:hypothetical protein